MAERIYRLLDKNDTTHNEKKAAFAIQSNAGDRVCIDLLDSFAMLPRQNENIDCARIVPFDRWDVERRETQSIGQNQFSLRFGNFVDAVHEFDHEFFKVTTLEANIMDPQHRCLMSSLARIKGAYLSQTAISIGIAKMEDSWDILHSTECLIKEGNGMVSTARSAGAAAGRLSFTFNFSGPSISIDTACSSSLVALKILCDDKFQKVGTHGFAGGVSLPMNVRTSMMLAASSMLAVDGRCKTLDSSANGYGRAEGCIMVKIRFRHIRNDNSVFEESIQARLVSTAVNQDGCSSSLTAPYGPSQENLFRMAMHYANIYPSHINITGTHGTGTALGDPIEINALTRAIAQSRSSITLPSSKATYGHSETASGLLGMIFNIQILEKQQVYNYPTLRALNKHVEGPLTQASQTIRICRQAQPLGTIKEPNIASVSAFAFQGTNAMAIIEQQEKQKKIFTSIWVPNQKPCMQYTAGHPIFRRISSMRKLFTIQCKHVSPLIHLIEHRVRNRPIMPASCYLEVMMSVATTLRNTMGAEIQHTTFKRPFELQEDDFKVSCDILSGEIAVKSEKSASHKQDYCSARFKTRQEYVNYFTISTSRPTLPQPLCNYH